MENPAPGLELASPAPGTEKGKVMGRLATALFDIFDEEVSFTKRGFRGCDEPARERLEAIGRVFVNGYRAALADDRPQPLAGRLDETEAAFRGFAYEGAAMGLTILDAVQPWRKPRLEAFLEGPGAPHTYIAHVGVGWGLARIPRGFERRLARLDPILRWLAVDGFGFHEGFFHWPRAVSEQQVPEKLKGYGRRAFDQGLGRSLWFVEGAGAERVVAAIAGFPGSRRGDLWSGVGLACAYAGGVPPAAVEGLCQACGDFLPEVAQGATFAARARQAAGNPTPWTELACRVLCGLSAEKAARRAEDAGQDLPEDRAEEPAFEVWRGRIQDAFRRERTEAWQPQASFSVATG